MRPIWERGEELFLEAKKISVSYNSVRAIEEVSFRVDSGEIVALVGPNGAGKSTALKAIFGLIKLQAGDILFQDESIKGLRPDELVHKGISLVPDGRRLFPSMTVLENLEMGAFLRRDKNIQNDIEKIFGLFPALKQRIKQKAGTLSTGEQQMLAFGRAMMQRPKLLLADEPSVGLSPDYVDTIFEKIVEINKSGTSILLVEQNARMALEIAHRGYVFKIVSIFLEGAGKELLEKEDVKKVLWGD
ncbi:MAG: ABC transporter ATP-binding protein [Candidatus Brocadia sp.]|uniref:Chain A of ATP binding cassette transporter n=1 Tax=Candidatus Brocadia fulgida TaxID=380242 RepID=A0A0M2UX77_9BACT|nr:MAG: chain A of ATP binding cassette transporter [Candidatus Brocadia fulgida]UJS19561.1 MAG: ABC transporter ATP-binding protein [Candidatus Brocadia sp.]